MMLNSWLWGQQPGNIQGRQSDRKADVDRTYKTERHAPAPISQTTLLFLFVAYLVTLILLSMCHKNSDSVLCL